MLHYRHEALRPTLGNAGAITGLTSRVTCEGDFTSQEFVSVVKALTSFSAESVNRIKLRESGALKVFVGLLKCSRHKAVHQQIVVALPRYEFVRKGFDWDHSRRDFP